IIGPLQNKLKILKESLLDNFELASSTMENIASSLGYVTELKHIELLRKTVSEKRQSTLAFRMNELPHVATTVHSSKGLEYDQVIIFANDYDLDNENDVYNHYVAVTRAISKLIIIILKDDVQQHRGKQFCSKLNKRFSNQNVDLQDIMTIV
ncbi:ATP-binding domain-containing protein, partial [Limosilactobacillus mucosae]